MFFGILVKYIQASQVGIHRGVARRSDVRWAHEMLSWKPLRCSGREGGHPKTRWADELEKFAGSWQEAAQDVELWRTMEECFAAGVQ